MVIIKEDNLPSCQWSLGRINNIYPGKDSKVRVVEVNTTRGCAVLLEPQLLDIMIVQFRNEKTSNHGSIPITMDCNDVAFIVFEEGFHQPIKRTKQSVFLDVTVFRHTLVD
ncbi:hypothetical protein TNCV_2159621 [Trichonephila clavipes]|nr:hypothetical protein TNCV_2159621 [Trichonephila clavipes]